MFYSFNNLFLSALQNQLYQDASILSTDIFQDEFSKPKSQGNIDKAQMIATPPVDDLPTVPGSVDLLYHSYNFDPAFVLQGDIDILALDMFSTLIGLEPPSSIYGAFRHKKDHFTTRYILLIPSLRFILLIHIIKENIVRG